MGRKKSNPGQQHDWKVGDILRSKLNGRWMIVTAPQNGILLSGAPLEDGVRRNVDGWVDPYRIGEAGGDCWWRGDYIVKPTRVPAGIRRTILELRLGGKL